MRIMKAVKIAKRMRVVLVAALTAALAALCTLQAQAFSDTKIIVSGCSVEGGGLVADEARRVTVTLKNTSDEWDMRGIVVTGEWLDPQCPVEFEMTNQAFAGEIRAGQEVDTYFSVTTKRDSVLPVDSVSCRLHISYTGDGTTENTNVVTVQLPVYQPEIADAIINDALAPAGVQQETQPRGLRPRIYVYAAGTVLSLIGILIVQCRRRLH